ITQEFMQTLMPVVGSWEGTHAKGSCEPGQAGRCSHKQRPLVQWISLSRKPAAGTFLHRTIFDGRVSVQGGPTIKNPKPTRMPPPYPQGENFPLLARPCRPQQFAALVGREPVAQPLATALKSNRVAPASLFPGARGVGKTSTARIRAKALNCFQGPTAT